MGLGDISFRFALLENKLFEITDRTMDSTIPLPKVFSGDELVHFIKERWKSIQIALPDLSQPGANVSHKIIHLMPGWCDQGSELFKKSRSIAILAANADIMSLVDESERQIHAVKSRCESLAHGEERLPLRPLCVPKKGILGAFSEVVKAVGGGAGYVLTGALVGTGAIARRVFDFTEERVTKTIVPQVIHCTELHDKKLQKMQTILARLSGDSQKAASFAKNISEYSVAYLDTHVCHIREREIALRPRFLTYLFENRDIYVENPVLNADGRLLQDLLTAPKKREDLRKVIELNVVLFLNNMYDTLNRAFDETPYALAHLIHSTLLESIKELEKIEEHRDEVDGAITLLGSRMGLDERNALLSRKVTKDLAAVFLKVGLPPESQYPISLPAGSVSLPGGSWLFETKKPNRSRIVSICQECTETILYDALVEMSNHSDIQEELLLAGYRALNEFLKPALVVRSQQEMQVSTGEAFVDFFIALFTSFFQEVGTLFTDPRRQGKKILKTDFMGAPQLQEAVQQAISAVFPNNWIAKKASPYLASSITPQLAETLKDFGREKCINAALEQMSPLIDLSRPREELFPMKQTEVDMETERRDQRRLQRARDIAVEEQRLLENVPFMAQKVADAIGPDITPLSQKNLESMGKVTRIWKKMCLSIRIFVNKILRQVVLTIFKIAGVPMLVKNVSMRVRETAKIIPQDAFAIFMMDWIGKRAQETIERNSTNLQK